MKGTRFSDDEFMRLALQQAEIAASYGETPVGAVIVYDGGIVAQGYNRRETWHDPTAHAEVIAIRRAAKVLGRWRLTGCTLYVTLEPCPMCAGALVLARLDRLVYGAPDPKSGAVDSLYRIPTDPRLNHRLDVTGGVLQEECAQLLQNFFRRLRSQRSML